MLFSKFPLLSHLVLTCSRRSVLMQTIQKIVCGRVSMNECMCMYACLSVCKRQCEFMWVCNYAHAHVHAYVYICEWVPMNVCVFEQDGLCVWLCTSVCIICACVVCVKKAREETDVGIKTGNTIFGPSGIEILYCLRVSRWKEEPRRWLMSSGTNWDITGCRTDVKLLKPRGW